MEALAFKKFKGSECMNPIDTIVVVRGGGDIASGTIHRLNRCGFKVVVLELPQPLVVRRTVSFAQAVIDGEITVEGVRAVRVEHYEGVCSAWSQNCIPVMVDPDAALLKVLRPGVVVDATMAKRNLGTHRGMAPITIALGPGFEAGKDVDAVIETHEGHYLGTVITEGSAASDTGLSVPLLGYSVERVLRAPCSGHIENRLSIGDTVVSGDIITHVDGVPVVAEISGVIHGLIQNGMYVTAGLKIGDVDPRGVQSYCFTIFDKARAIGGGVIEAIFYLNNLQSRGSKAVA
jgi:xanthine dehydrogenase accessory factor